VRVLTVLLALTVLSAAACTDGRDPTANFSERGVHLQIPSAWSITGFSTTNAPSRLVAASYSVRPEDSEGDCGGNAAIARLPEDGAFIALIDYDEMPVDRGDFPDTLPVASVDDLFDRRRFLQFDCFGPSYMLRLIVNRRPIQVHVGLGKEASSERRAEVVAIVNSITVES
jgi:hypothetical protein